MALLASEEKRVSEREMAFLELHSLEYEGNPTKEYALARKWYSHELVYLWGPSRGHIQGSERNLVSGREAKQALKRGLFASFNLFP